MQLLTSRVYQCVVHDDLVLGASTWPVMHGFGRTKNKVQWDEHQLSPVTRDNPRTFTDVFDCEQNNSIQKCAVSHSDPTLCHINNDVEIRINSPPWIGELCKH